MRTLFALVRCYDTMPVAWVSAQACPLDEKNGKEGCEAVRLITIVEEMGNSFVGTLLERSIRGRSARPYASGYQHGPSRFEAIVHQWVIAYRARAAGRNFQSLQQGCQECICEPRARATKMHVWVLGFAMLICASVNHLIKMLDVELFKAHGEQLTFFKMCVIRRWLLASTGGISLNSWVATWEKILDLPITSHADDVAKGTIFKDGQELQQLVLVEEMALSDSLQRFCTAQWPAGTHCEHARSGLVG